MKLALVVMVLSFVLASPTIFADQGSERMRAGNESQRGPERLRSEDPEADRYPERVEPEDPEADRCPERVRADDPDADYCLNRDGELW